MLSRTSQSFFLGLTGVQGKGCMRLFLTDPEDHMATFWQKDLNNFVPLL